MANFIYKRKQNYFWERCLVEVTKHPVMLLIHTKITPNMITLFNMFLIFPMCCYFAWIRNYYLVSLLIQIYCLLDVMDGNLARNKNMASTLGKKLDEYCDTFFYLFFFLLLGYRMNTPFGIVLFSSISQHVYGLIATYYIAPKVRNNPGFKRTRLKQFFFNRGILFGMDATLHSLLVSLMIVTPARNWVFWITSACWVLDLIYRTYEVKMQTKALQ